MGERELFFSSVFEEIQNESFKIRCGSKRCHLGFHRGRVITQSPFEWQDRSLNFEFVQRCDFLPRTGRPLGFVRASSADSSPLRTVSVLLLVSP